MVEAASTTHPQAVSTYAIGWHKVRRRWTVFYPCLDEGGGVTDSRNLAAKGLEARLDLRGRIRRPDQIHRWVYGYGNWEVARLATTMVREQAQSRFDLLR